jgi:putative phosphoribosyl transferase
MTASVAPPEALYPSRTGAGSFLGRQLYSRFQPPVVVLGIAPSGVEVAAAAAKAMSCSFDVIVGAHIRLDDKVVGAVAEDGDSVLDPDFAPGFAQMEALNEAIDRARRAIKAERLLFRGQRQLRSLEGANVVIVDGQITSPWKVLAAADVARKMGALRIGIAAPVSTQPVQERVRARKLDFVSPSILLDAGGHARPFGDPEDPSAERLRSIVVARQAA